MTRTDDTVLVERRNRATGTLVVLAWNASDETYETICVDHGGVCSHATRKLAESFLSHPDEWCEDCMYDEGTLDGTRQEPARLMALSDAERAKRYRDRHRVQLAERTCEECGSTFQPRRRDQLTCSGKCRSRRSRRLRSEKPKARAVFRGLREPGPDEVWTIHIGLRSDR